MSTLFWALPVCSTSESVQPRHSEAQKTILDTKLAELRKTQTVNLHTAAVTDVYRAEEYHQRYRVWYFHSVDNSQFTRSNWQVLCENGCRLLGSHCVTQAPAEMCGKRTERMMPRKSSFRAFSADTQVTPRHTPKRTRPRLKAQNCSHC